MFLQKSISLKHRELLGLLGVKGEKKRGTPKNAGISQNVYENKGRKKSHGETLRILLNTNKLLRLFGDVFENKGESRLTQGQERPSAEGILAGFRQQATFQRVAAS